MTASITIDDELFQQIHEDLHRPHAFAAERVGFITCSAARIDATWHLTAMFYEPVPDNEYVDDPSVGAAVSGAAFRRFMMRAHGEPVSIFHVHRHDHRGRPNFSSVDRRESQRFVPDFLVVRPELPHGAIVLSYDEAHALLWDPLLSERPTVAHLCIAAVPHQRELQHDQSTQQTRLSRTGLGVETSDGDGRRHWIVRWWLACVAAVGAHWRR